MKLYLSVRVIIIAEMLNAKVGHPHCPMDQNDSGTGWNFRPLYTIFLFFVSVASV